MVGYGSAIEHPASPTSGHEVDGTAAFIAGDIGLVVAAGDHSPNYLLASCLTQNDENTGEGLI